MEWERAARRRLSRRRLLGAAGAVAGAAGLASFGCGGNSGSSSLPPPGGSADSGDDVGSTAVPASTRPPLSERQGETLRYTGYVSGVGIYAPHTPPAAPFYGLEALVLSRLLAYQDQASGSIVPDLAVAMPERPDSTTLIFRLNPAAKWHDRAPLNGRQVTSEDVKYSIERQMNGDPTFVRKGRWLIIDSIETPSPTEVRVKLKSQFANAEGLFANVTSFIVAPEAVDAGEFTSSSQPGSGPFRWVEWNEGNFASVARNPNWHGGNQRPYLNGIELHQPKDASDIEAGLRTKKLDAVFVGRPTADALKKNIPALVESQAGHSLYFGMRFFINQVPYNDLRFRAALSIALDRRDMVEKFFAGSGDVNPWVSWPIKDWTLPQSELTNFPGYRLGDGGRQADIADAKSLLAAAAGETAIPEELPLFVEAAAEQNLGMGTLMQQQLQANLGLKVSVHPFPIGDLIRLMFEGNAPWVAGPDTGWVDLDEWVYPYFHSTGSNNSFPIRDPDLDALLDAQRAELDFQKRQGIGYEIQRRLLNLHAGVNFCSERVIALAWPYVKGFPMDTADGYQHRFADCWIDRSDPSFRGR
ncbi:MAG: ABC transporter substrate-binding protein [Hyphomicrobiales bacterium]